MNSITMSVVTAVVTVPMSAESTAVVAGAAAILVFIFGYLVGRSDERNWRMRFGQTGEPDISNSDHGSN